MPEPVSIDPNRPLRWGVLGTGRILPKLAHALRHARQVELQAVASRDDARAQAAAQEHGFRRSYASYDQLLADPDVDVVLNALHNGLHCEWTVRALQAGKHVLCEKPLARSSAEAEQMFAAAKAHQRWLLEGFMFRFHPQMGLVHQLIREGRIGQLVHLRCSYLSLGREKKNPRYRKETGGGALLDLGCYCANFLRAFAGSEPVRVVAHEHRDAETDIELTLAGALHFPGGLTGQFACSFETEGLYSADLVGTTGRIHIPHPWRPPTWPALLEIVRLNSTERIEVNPPDTSHDDLLPFILEIEHLSECVRTGRPPTYPPGVNAEQDARANARVLDALAKAAATGQPVATGA